MKIISYNVNGIRSALSKGFDTWLAQELPDVIHIQETKADESQVDLSFLWNLGYKHAWFAAEKRGYSGVATFYKPEVDFVKKGIGIKEYDSEGRTLRLDFGDITLINSYFPSGTMGDSRQDVKERYLEDILSYLNDLRKERPNIILSGDFNICHTEIDINNPKRHKDCSGFLPNEREWIDRLIASGMTDGFRMFNTQPEQYSWWSYRAGSRAKNLGWRIDYHFVSNTIVDRVRSASILNQVVHSDHCPIVVEIE